MSFYTTLWNDPWVNSNLLEYIKPIYKNNSGGVEEFTIENLSLSVRSRKGLVDQPCVLVSLVVWKSGTSLYLPFATDNLKNSLIPINYNQDDISYLNYWDIDNIISRYINKKVILNAGDSIIFCITPLIAPSFYVSFVIKWKINKAKKTIYK